MDKILVLVFLCICCANGQQSGQPPTSQPAAAPDNSSPRFSIGLGVLSPSYSQKFGDDGKIRLDYNAPNEKGAFSYSVSNLVHPVIKHSESAPNDKGLAAPVHKDESPSHFSPSLPTVSANHGNQNHGSKPDYSGFGGGYFPAFNAPSQQSQPSHSSPSPPQAHNYPGNAYNHQQQNYGNGGAVALQPQQQTGQYFNHYNPGSYNVQSGAYNQNPSAYGSTTHNSPQQQSYSHSPQVQQPLQHHQSPSVGHNQYLGHNANTNGYGQQGYYPQSAAHGQHNNQNNGLYGSGSQHGSSLTPYNDNNNANYGTHQGYQSYGGLSPEAVNAFRQMYASGSYASGSDNYLNYIDPYAMYGQSPYSSYGNLGSYGGLRSMAYSGYGGLRSLLG